VQQKKLEFLDCCVLKERLKRVRRKDNLLIATLLLYIIPTFLGSRLELENAEYIWDICTILSSLLPIWYIYLITPFKKILLKLLCFCLVFINTYFFIDYILIIWLLNSPYLNVIYNITGFVGLMLATLLLGKLLYFSKDKGDIYLTCKSYLAYKYPKNLLGMIASIFSHYGQVCLVTKGRKFSFKNGVIMESELERPKEFIYKQIPTITLHTARELIGTKWTYTNNCFNVFHKYNKK